MQAVASLRAVSDLVRPQAFDFNRILTGDARTLLPGLPAASVGLSCWSPPYYVGKSYERHLSFEEWQVLLQEVVTQHARGLGRQWLGLELDAQSAELARRRTLVS